MRCPVGAVLETALTYQGCLGQRSLGNGADLSGMPWIVLSSQRCLGNGADLSLIRDALDSVVQSALSWTLSRFIIDFEMSYAKSQETLVKNLNRPKKLK